MKKAICKIFAHFLYRGMKVLYKKDQRVREEIDAIKENTCFVLQFDMKKKSSFVAIEKTNKGLKKRKYIKDTDIVIVFKNLDIALKVMTGQKGLCDAYAEHDFILKGSINDCMVFVRIVELVMTHLLPKKMLKKILREVPKRSISMLTTYVCAIFGN